jgi:hypothetical protein
LGPCLLCKALPGFFICIFSCLTCLKKPVFIKQHLLRWKVPARLQCNGFFWLGEKEPEYKPFQDFRPVPLAYPPRWGTDLKSRKDSGPSPIHKILLHYQA